MARRMWWLEERKFLETTVDSFGKQRFVNTFASHGVSCNLIRVGERAVYIESVGRTERFSGLERYIFWEAERSRERDFSRSIGHQHRTPESIRPFVGPRRPAFQTLDVGGGQARLTGCHDDHMD